MAIRGGNIAKIDARPNASRLGVALGWLCLTAAGSASADGLPPGTPGFVPTTGLTASPALPPAIPLPFNGLQPHQTGQATDLLSLLGGTGATPLTIPLNVQFGRGGGVSFLYNQAAASPDGTPGGAGARAATYGFSNALAFGHDAMHLNGLMYFAGGQGADGKSKQSQLVSQALAFENKGWKLDAHYQSVGKDFGAGDNIKAAAAKLGFAANLTDAQAGQLEGLRGQNDLGFSLARADAHGSFGLGFGQNVNSVTHLTTTQQSLSLARTFGKGLQFEAGRNTVSVKAGDGGDITKALTTTTNHLKLGLDGGKGLSFSAEANLIGDNHGRAEQHMAYTFADQIKDTHFSTRFLSNSLVKGDGSTDGKTADQTLGVDIDRQSKGLGLKASFLQVTTSGLEHTSKTTEHLELGLKNTQIAFNLQSNSKTAGGTNAADKTLNLDMIRQTKGLSLKASLVQFTTTDLNAQGKTNANLDMNWQARPDVTVGAHLAQAAVKTNSTGKTDSDRILGVDVARQGKGLTWQASLVQEAPTAENAQAKTTEHLEMNWQARQNISLQAHWNLVSNRIVHPDPQAQAAGRDQNQDLTATLTNLRLHGLRNSQAVLNLTQALSQGKNQTDTRALRFDTDMPDTHVHLEYVGSNLGWDQTHNSLVSRAIRVASIAPGDWLHYSAYYRQRSQTLGGHLPDIRDYQVGMQLKHLKLAYHYMNQQEQPDGSVKDTVESHYQVDGPLTKKLAWNLQYDQTNDRTGKSGLECWLIGFKTDTTPHFTLEAMIGRPELRVDGTTVPGETFKLNFICKMDETDSVALNGEVTNWTRKTRDTPHTVDGKVRLDLNKGF